MSSWDKILFIGIDRRRKRVGWFQIAENILWPLFSIQHYGLIKADKGNYRGTRSEANS
jgi:hypothetical protein